MSSADEQLTERFYEWEIRGRGWQVFDFPVLPEPAFREFDGHYLPPAAIADDGRRSTTLSRLADSLGFGSPSPTSETEAIEETAERDSVPFERSDLTEIVVTFPPDTDVRRDTFEEFLFNLSSCEEPIAFEVVAARDAIRIQFATGNTDAQIIKKFLQAYFPAAVVTLQSNQLSDTWRSFSTRNPFIVEFGLEQEFMLPLSSRRADFMVALTAALSDLKEDDLAVFQILFQPVQWPWPSSFT